MAAEHRPNLALHRQLVAAAKAAGGVGEKQAVADRLRSLMGSGSTYTIAQDGVTKVSLEPGSLPALSEAIGLPAKPPVDAIADVADTSTGVWTGRLASGNGTYTLTTTAVGQDGTGLKIPAELDSGEVAAFSGSIAVPDPLTGSEVDPGVPPGQRDALLQPFASESPWNHPIGSGAIYGGTSTQLQQIRNEGTTAVSPSTAENRMWCMPVAVAGPTTPLKRVRVVTSPARTIEIPIPDGFDAALPYPTYSGVPGAPAGQGGDGHMAVRWRDANGHPWIDEFYGARRTDAIAGHQYIAKGWIRMSARKHGIGYGGVSPAGGWPANNRPWNGQHNFVVPSGSVGWESMSAATTDTPGEDGNTGSVRAYGGSASAGVYTTGDFDHTDGPQHAGSVAVPHRVQRRQTTGQCNLARWPARRNDCVLYGVNGQLEQGMLLAIPASVNLASAGLTSNGYKLARSWQLRGLYIVDQSSTGESDAGTFNIYCDPEAPDVVAIMLGLRNSGELQTIRNMLTLVTNNTATNRGGGGTPLAPFLPEAY